MGNVQSPTTQKEGKNVQFKSTLVDSMTDLPLQKTSPLCSQKPLALDLSRCVAFAPPLTAPDPPTSDTTSDTTLDTTPDTSKNVQENITHIDLMITPEYISHIAKNLPDPSSNSKAWADAIKAEASALYLNVIQVRDLIAKSTQIMYHQITLGSPLLSPQGVAIRYGHIEYEGIIDKMLLNACNIISKNNTDLALLTQIHQKKEETAADYIIRFITLFDRHCGSITTLKGATKLQIYLLVQGLQNHLRLLITTNPLWKTLSLEGIETLIKHYDNTTEPQHTSSQPTPGLRTGTEIYFTSAKRIDYKKIQCYSCGKFGHTQRTCYSFDPKLPFK